MGEPGGLLSMGLHRVGHDWSDLAAAAAAQGKSAIILMVKILDNDIPGSSVHTHTHTQRDSSQSYEV